MPYIECALTFIDDRHAEYADDQHKGLGAISGDVGGDELSLETVRKLNEWVRNHSELCRRSELSLLGRHLYRIAFETPTNESRAGRQPPLKEAFENTFKRFSTAVKDNKSTRMRIKLVFARKAETLAGLPWEFLYMPLGVNEGIFLAQRAELILTRFVPEQESDADITTDSESEKLRILVVKAEPRELADVKGTPTVDEIKKLRSDHIDVRVFEGRATLAALRECISGSESVTAYRPHIVHLMGHGEAGKLVLLKELALVKAEELEVAARRREAERLGQLAPSGERMVNEGQALDIESIKSLFNEHKPRVVFLHACLGAAPDSLETFRSTARELAYSGIPAVIAMQYEIGNNEAELFAKTFYSQLRMGTNVDEAVTAARQKLGLSVLQPGRNVWDERSFGTPVIYLRTERPIILPPVSRAEAQTVPAKEPCPNPDCTGWVIKGRLLCIKCKKALKTCPECGVLMLADGDICDQGHRSDAAKPAAVAAAGASGEAGKFFDGGRR